MLPPLEVVAPPELPRSAADSVDALVRRINGIVAVHCLQAAVEVGTLVLDEFYAGDYQAFCDRNSHKHTGLRELAARSDLVLSASTLHRYVQVAHQLQQLPSSVAARLSLQCHYALIRVRDPADKMELALRAALQGWTARRLEGEVRSHLGCSPRPGRPPKLPLQRLVQGVERLLADSAAAVLQDGPGDLTEARLRDFIRRLDRARAEIDEVLRVAGAATANGC